MTTILKDEGDQEKHEKPNIKGDKVNITLLLLLYMQQGAVFGLSSAFPIIFQNRKVSYAEQAIYSITGYPFCFKILWAPLVDCVYSKKFGRRKTWLIPMQYLIGGIFLFVSMRLDHLLGSENGTQKPKVHVLASLFFMATFFNAMQDVALDGWSLTMLQRRNVQYAATCQNVGSTTGTVLAHVLFIVLDSKDFCNNFRTIPKDYGFVSFDNFIFVFGLVCIISTTLVLVFKKDTSLDFAGDEDYESRLSLQESYKHLWQILKIRPIIVLSIVLLTCRIGFGPQTAVAPLKMLETGASRENFVLLTVLALPFQILFSIVFRRQVTGPRALRSFFFTYILKLLLGVLLSTVLFFAPYLRDDDTNLPVWYYWALFFVYNTKTVITYMMSLSLGGFFYRVSDPRYGGIYLTIMGTVVNLGNNWPITLCLWFVDFLTIKHCDEDNSHMITTCQTKFDGFYIETIIFTILGVLWLWWGKKAVYKLEKVESSVWLVERKSPTIVKGATTPILSHNNPNDQL